jgi:hypothetical protein
MGLLRYLVRVTLLTSLALTGCSDTPPPPPPGGGTGGTRPPITPGTGGSGSGGVSGAGGSGGTAGRAGSGGTAGSGGEAGEGGAGGEAGAGGVGGGIADDACDNLSDQSVLTGLVPDNARRVAAECGTVDCAPVLGQGEMAFKLCATDCVERNVTGLSMECASCYGDLAWSARLLCNTSCAENSCVPGCLTCGNYSQWLQELDACAGRMSLDCGDDT